MATKTTNNEENIIAGIDTEVNPVAAEEDFVKGLLAAASYKEDEKNFKEIEIIRDGIKYFSFTVRPISSDELHAARKKGAKFVKNPVNKKLPLIESEKDFDTTLFHSWIIYTATIDRDKERVWNNPALKNKYGFLQPVESIAICLMSGEMTKVVNVIMDMSDVDNNDEEDITENVIKN